MRSNCCADLHGAILVTGHASDDATTTPNWRALVATELTLVIYMGVARCESIQRDLLTAGMAPLMPVAVITTLEAMAADIRAANIGSPAIIVAGETVRYARREGGFGTEIPMLPMRQNVYL